jgi:trimeric autotransporter adhesin
MASTLMHRRALEQPRRALSQARPERSAVPLTVLAQPAIGAASSATGVASSALGAGASAGGNNATAIGTGAVANRDNQISVGTSGNQYTLAGITSGTSKSLQSGPLEVVTSDANGNLATDGGSIFRQLNNLNGRVDKAFSGVAIATAMQNPDLVGGEKFGVAVNWGDFAGYNAVAVTAQGVIGHDWVAQGDRVALTGGIGFGTDHSGEVAGRVGVQWTH